MRTILFSLFFLPILLFPQSSKFKTFAYNGAWGIADTNLQEILKPAYYRYEGIPSEEALLFTNFDNGIEYLYFNLIDASKRNYDNYDLTAIKIENEDYSLIQDANKYYLKNEKTNSEIVLPYPIEEINKLGKNYIIAKYDLAEEVPKAPRKGKNGLIIPEPPKLYSLNKNFVIFKNDKQLPKVFKIETVNYSPLYLDQTEARNKKEGSDIVLAETVELEFDRNIDYIIFNSDNNYELYTADFKLIKKFIYKGEYSNIAEKCSKIVGKSLSTNPYEVYPNTASYRDEYMSMPEFESVFENGIYKIICTDKNKPSVVCESANKLIYDDRNPNQIFIFDTEKEDYMAKFDFDRNTFKLFLPLKYYSLLKLSLPKK